MTADPFDEAFRKSLSVSKANKEFEEQWRQRAILAAQGLFREFSPKFSRFGYLCEIKNETSLDIWRPSRKHLTKIEVEMPCVSVELDYEDEIYNIRTNAMYLEYSGARIDIIRETLGQFLGKTLPDER